LHALVFNASLLALAGTGAHLATQLERTELVVYEATPTALAATRSAIERQAARGMPSGVDRVAYWSSLVRSEIDEGDPMAARGFVLSAPEMLEGRDQTRFSSKLPPDASDTAIISAALNFLTPATRDRMQEVPTSQPDERIFYVLGDANELARDAQSWTAGVGGDREAYMLRLSAVGVALSASPAAVSGASLLKSAHRTGAVSEALQTRLLAMMEQAAPADRLRAALSQEMTLGAATPESVRRAFTASVNADAYASLLQELERIASIADAGGFPLAVRLVRHADTPRDIDRLRLIARAAGDRAAAVAKHTASSANFVSAAQGTLRIPFDIGLAIAGVVSALALCLWTAWRSWRARPRSSRNEKTNPAKK
jgi:hypothetical protein